jgi:hypothetical protein
MKHIKLFEQFINEGGHLITNAQQIEQEDVEPTVKWIERNIFNKIGLSGIDIDAAVIGSAGKKLAGQTSGDIDIAVSADKIAAALGCSLQNTLFELNDKLKSLGYETEMSAGFNQVSIGVPIKGDKKNGIIQIDLMLSTNLEWSRFIYYSPDFRAGESKYKGAYRNILLMAAVGNSFYKTVSTTDAGETKEYEAYVVRLNQGIVQVRKSFEGKRGLLKTAALLHEYDKEIAKTPQAVVDLLFNGNYVPSDINTYEKLKSMLESSDFKYPNALPTIMRAFVKSLQNQKLPLPSDIEGLY